MLSSTLRQKTFRHELLYKEYPFYMYHLRPFGCKVLFTPVQRTRETFATRLEHGICLWHHGGGVYRILSASCTHLTKHVLFSENEFPGLSLSPHGSCRRLTTAIFTVVKMTRIWKMTSKTLMMKCRFQLTLQLIQSLTIRLYQTQPEKMMNQTRIIIQQRTYTTITVAPEPVQYSNPECIRPQKTLL